MVNSRKVDVRKKCNLENLLNSISTAAIVFVILRDFDSVSDFMLRERYSIDKTHKKENKRSLANHSNLPQLKSFLPKRECLIRPYVG